MQYIIPFFHARIPNPYIHQLFSLYCDEALNFYKDIRSALAKLRFHEERREISRRQLASEKGRINSALLGGSTKKLYPLKAFTGTQQRFVMRLTPTSSRFINALPVLRRPRHG
jgi:hypothetical protein